MATGDERAGQYHPFALVGLAVTGVLTGAALGALTNSVNGWVSPLYFHNILRWHDVEDVWRASVAQGIFEGLLFGLFLALVFTVVVGCVSKARCSYRFGVVTRRRSKYIPIGVITFPTTSTARSHGTIIGFRLDNMMVSDVSGTGTWTRACPGC